VLQKTIFIEDIKVVTQTLCQEKFDKFLSSSPLVFKTYEIGISEHGIWFA